MDKILDKLEDIHKDIQDLKTSKRYIEEDLKVLTKETKSNTEFRWKAKGAIAILAAMVLPPFIQVVKAMLP